MKILQVIPSLDPGFGGPTYATLGMAMALAKAGQEVSIYTTDAGVKSWHSVRPFAASDLKGVELRYFPFQILRHYKFSYPLASALSRGIPAFNIVHVHSLFQFSTLAASFYCRKYKKPYMLRPLGQLDPYLLKRHAALKGIYMSLFENRNINTCSALHFTAEREKELACGFLPKTAKALVIPLGISGDEFGKPIAYGLFRKKYPALEGKQIILFLGRISFKKGLDILIKAFADVSRKRKGVALVIAGPDDEGFGRKVKSWVKKEGLQDDVVFTGMLRGQERLAAMKDSDVFVLASYSENFGLAVIEALAMGLSVVISDKVNIYKEIEQANAGVIVRNDPAQLSSAIMKLLEGEDLRRQLAANGRRLVRERFDWDIVAAQLIAAYKEILNLS